MPAADPLPAAPAPWRRALAFPRRPGRGARPLGALAAALLALEAAKPPPVALLGMAASMGQHRPQREAARAQRGSRHPDGHKAVCAPATSRRGDGGPLPRAAARPAGRPRRHPGRGPNSQPIEAWLEAQLGLDAGLGAEARAELTVRLLAEEDREPTQGAVTTLTAEQLRVLVEAGVCRVPRRADRRATDGRELSLRVRRRAGQSCGPGGREGAGPVDAVLSDPQLRAEVTARLAAGE